MQIIKKQKRKTLYSSFEKRDFKFIYLLILFPVLQFLVFWLYVNLSSITLAFQTIDGIFTLDNIKSAFSSLTKQDMYGFNLGKMILRSLSIWAITNIVCAPVAVAATYILFKRVMGHYVFRVCFMIPGIVGGVVWISLLRYLVAYDGPVIDIVQSLGVQLPPMALRNGLLSHEATAFPTILVITFITSLVGNNVVLTGAFSRIPAEIFESSRLDGAGFWREFVSISLPCVWPTLATLYTFAFCSILTADNNVFLFSQGTGSNGMATVGFYLYYLTLKLSETGGNYNYPAALGVLLTMFAVPIALTMKKVLEKAVEPVEY